MSIMAVQNVVFNKKKKLS